MKWNYINQNNVFIVRVPFINDIKVNKDVRWDFQKGIMYLDYESKNIGKIKLNQKKLISKFIVETTKKEIEVLLDKKLF